jgi:predicted MPP superfamily phosphohydrolase
VKWVGNKPLYILFVLSEKPSTWTAGQVALFPLVMALGAALLWAGVTAHPVWGWAVGLGFIILVITDWGLLTALPRRGLSFGPVQPALLAFAGLRWLAALGGALPAAQWPILSLIAVLFCQVVISSMMVYGTMIEPFRLKTTCVDIGNPKLLNPGTPLRIVQLSDLHVERLTSREHALPSIVAGLKPDLVVLTGDFLNKSYNRDPRALHDLGMLLAQLHAPAGIYAVWGTVDVDLPDHLRPVLEEHGVVVLEDRAIEVAVGGHPIWLMGISCSSDLSRDAARLSSLLAKAPPQALSLLLYHTPDLMPTASSLGVDLYLAGHTHGGQWCLPWFGAIVTSSRFWKRFEAGHYVGKKTYLYVSRGLGLEGFGTPRARFFCPPEVVLLRLSVPADSSGEKPTACSISADPAPRRSLIRSISHKKQEP